MNCNSMRQAVNKNIYLNHRSSKYFRPPKDMRSPLNFRALAKGLVHYRTHSPHSSHHPQAPTPHYEAYRNRQRTHNTASSGSFAELSSSRATGSLTMAQPAQVRGTGPCEDYACRKSKGNLFPLRHAPRRSNKSQGSKAAYV